MKQTEKQFQATVVEWAQWCGWEVWSTWLSINSPDGEPDLRLVRPPRVIFAELKSEKGTLSLKQGKALALLWQCPGVEAYLWRPSDWETIEEVLR